MAQQTGAIGIFCCYAWEDRVHLDQLKAHLSPLQRQNILHIWHDGDMRLGASWHQETKQYLNEADIILLLLSADFIASEYCYHIEMMHALQRYRRGEARVIPILLRPVARWETLAFGDLQLGCLQALPTDGQAVTTWDNRDLVWQRVVEGIGKVASELPRRSFVSQSRSPAQPSGEESARIVQENNIQRFFCREEDQTGSQLLAAGLLSHFQPGEVKAVSTHHAENAKPAFDGSSIEELIDALRSAFPTPRDLKLFISYKLLENMEVIAAGNDLEERVHSLVMWAYSRGQVKALVAGALARNPGNPKLLRVAAKYSF